MRAALILGNLLLAVWLLAAVGGRFTGGTSTAEEFSVKKSDPAKKSAATVGAAVKKAQPESIDSLLATIVDNNIFNPDRCPNAVFGRGRSARVELTLVGTFEIGPSKGAIILQKTSSNNRNFPGMMGGMGGMGMMGGGPGGMGMGGMGGPPGMQQGGGGQTTSSTTRQNAGRNRFSGNQSGGSGNSETDANSGQIGALKQYVRVGDTLSNGYTLTEITRTGAVLTRGSDKMELELQEASKNQTKAATATNSNPRTGVMQQLQQMQQMQMMQNFQMMRMMRDTSRNQNQNQNQSGNRGGNTGGNTGGRSGGGFGGGPPGM